ncbi:MAG TPA: IS481 family transposase [Acidimicrobiales bacterium]|nr:IS481 family transposase [Acidimicrobiales bacterium]
MAPRSKRPLSSPTRVPAKVEDEIIRLRKSLLDQGLDAGAHTIGWHLSRRRGAAPSSATIWRVLARRGFVVPQPQKRPRSSYIRFEADLPNERWQADTTHWRLADGTDVEILNIVDDHSRLLVASVAFVRTKTTDVIATFRRAGDEHGYPASLLTDNGAIFTAEFRGGRCAMELELAALGIAHNKSRPYHPQTCGKVERFHQTLKRWLDKQPAPASRARLQRQLDRFRTHYNTARPHRALGRRTPGEAFAARTKAAPTIAGIRLAQHRVRRDKIGPAGKVTLRYRSRLLHIGVGRAHAGTDVLLLVADDDVRIVSLDGELLRHLTIDPTRNYQPLKRA